MKSAEEIRKILNAPEDPGLGYIAHYEQYEQEILKGYTMDVVKYGFELDRFCPAKLGQLTVVVGHTNVGKTTVLLWLLSKLANAKKKILIYSAENRISTLHRQFVKFLYRAESIGKHHLEQSRDVVRYIKHEKHFSYKEMLNQATYLLDAGYEFDFFLIDPYNALRIDNKGMNTHDYHYQAAEEMRIFTITTNKSIFLNCHTVTEAQRVRPDTNGHRPAPLDSDVEGGAKFPNKADDTLVIHRQISATIQDERFITELHVRKVRNQEFGGEPTPFNEPIRIKLKRERSGFESLNHTFEPTVRNFYEIDKN